MGYIGRQDLDKFVNEELDMDDEEREGWDNYIEYINN